MIFIELTLNIIISELCQALLIIKTQPLIKNLTSQWFFHIPNNPVHKEGMRLILLLRDIYGKYAFLIVFEKFKLNYNRYVSTLFPR